MLLVIHNIPSDYGYADVKALIQMKSGLKELILDNLVFDGNGKKVTVGLADEGDAALLVRKLNGLYLSGQQLYVEDVRKKPPSEQPFRSTTAITSEVKPPQGYGQGYMQSQYMQAPMVDPMKTMNYNMGVGGTFYMPTMPQGVNMLPATNMQNNFMDYGAQSQQAVPGNQVVAPLATSHSRNELSRSFESSQDRQYEYSPSNNWSYSKPTQNKSQWESSNKPRDSRRRSPSPPRNLQNSYLRDEPMTFNQNLSTENMRGSEPFYTQYRNHYDERGSESKSRAPNRESRFDENPWGNSSQSNRDYADHNAPRGNFGPKKSQYQDHNQGSNISRPPRPETRRNQEQPRGAKRPNDRREEFVQNPPKRFAAAKTSVLNSSWSSVPPTTAAGRNSGKNWKPNVAQANTKDFKIPKKVDKPSFKPPQKEFAKPQTKQSNFKSAQKALSQKDINKAETWRGQATSQITKDIISHLKMDFTQKDEIFRQLKASIRKRIDTMCRNRLHMPSAAIVAEYRKKFPVQTYKQFFKSVLEELKKDKLSKANLESTKSDTKVESNKPGASNAAENKPAQNKPEVKKVGPKISLPAPLPSASGKVPKDTKDNRRLRKKVLNEEMAYEDKYVLPGLMQKALDEETDILCDLFMGVCEVPDQESEKKICEIISDRASDEFRRVIRLQVTKRILNVTTNLMLRVISQGPPPKAHALDMFFKKYGVVSVHKAKKTRMTVPMYIVTCDSYESYDRLCELQNAVVEGVTLKIKPFQLTGPPPKYSRQKVLNERKKFLHNQIDPSEVTNFEDDVIDEDSDDETGNIEHGEDVATSNVEDGDDVDQKEENDSKTKELTGSENIENDNVEKIDNKTNNVKQYDVTETKDTTNTENGTETETKGDRNENKKSEETENSSEKKVVHNDWLDNVELDEDELEDWL